jgi:DNA helicase-2/ATP-dependent DNA helicase PcrA
MLHGQTRYGIASRFFHEIPENLMKRVNPRFGFQNKGYASGGPRSANPQSPVAQHSSLVTETGWKVGQGVVHPTFGAGVIVNAEGRGADARVQVNFRNGGLKWLMLEYAKLAAA